MTQTIYTRADYMEDRVDHHTYYAAIAKVAGISYEGSPDMPRVKAALDAGDESLNSIPLGVWDMRAIHSRAAIARACRDHFPGESYSLAVGVCIHKAAAKAAFAAAML